MLMIAASTTAKTTPPQPKPVAKPIAPPSAPSSRTTAATSSSELRRLRSISRQKVVGARVALAVIGLGRAQVHLRHCGIGLGDLEVIALTEAEGPGDEDVREGLDRGVELPDRPVVVLPGE